MAYESASVWRAIHEALTTNPTTTLAQLTDALSVDRGVVESVCQEHDTSFRELRQAFVFTAAARLLAAPGAYSIKERAFTLGYTPRGFSRFVRRHSGLTPMALRQRLLKKPPHPS